MFFQSIFKEVSFYTNQDHKFLIKINENYNNILYLESKYKNLLLLSEYNTNLLADSFFQLNNKISDKIKNKNYTTITYYGSYNSVTNPIVEKNKSDKSNLGIYQIFFSFVNSSIVGNYFVNADTLCILNYDNENIDFLDSYCEKFQGLFGGIAYKLKSLNFEILTIERKINRQSEEMESKDRDLRLGRVSKEIKHSYNNVYYDPTEVAIERLLNDETQGDLFSD